MKLGESQRPGFARFARAGLLVAVLLAASGCTERYLQVAQDSFSKGAAIENQTKVGTAGDANTAQTMPLAGDALIYYVDAYQNVRKALDEGQDELDQQGLTASALALRALIAWRLDDLQGSRSGDPDSDDACAANDYRDCSKESSRMALELLKNQQFFVRDRFMMTILPGLLDHNLGLRATPAAPRQASEDFRSAYAHIDAGYSVLGQAPPQVQKTGEPTVEQELKAYALRAQYQTVLAWYAAIDAAFKGVDLAPEQTLTGDQRASCQGILQTGRASTLLNAMRSLDPNGRLVSSNLVASLRDQLGAGAPAAIGPEVCPWPMD